MDKMSLDESTCYHITPIDDLREHELTVHCWCDPEPDKEGVFIHNAMDGRAEYDPSLLRLQ